MAKKKDWKKIAQAIAKSKGWIVWIDTVMMIEEGKSEEIQFFEAAFKLKREPEHCPHCGKPIFNKFDGKGDYVYVSDPHNIIFHSEDIDELWKGLVNEYAKVFKTSVSKIEMELNIEGFL